MITELNALEPLLYISLNVEMFLLVCYVALKDINIENSPSWKKKIGGVKARTIFYNLTTQSALQSFNLTKFCSAMQKWTIIAFGVIVCTSATALHDNPRWYTRQSWINDDEAMKRSTTKQLSWWWCVHVFVLYLTSLLTNTLFNREHRVCLCSLTEIWMAHIRDGTKKRRQKPASGASRTIKYTQRKTHTHWVPVSGSQLRWGTRQPDFLFISSTSPPIPDSAPLHSFFPPTAHHSFWCLCSVS